MSLGTYENNRKQNSGPTVYSPYRVNNGLSEVDMTCMTYSYWNNMLRITIAPKKDTNNDEISFDMDASISIYLNHTKARMFADVIKMFLEDPDTYNNAGITAGAAAIIINNGKSYNAEGPVMIIRKIDNNTGEVLAEFAYEFKRNYHFAITNYDGTSFDRLYDPFNDIEIKQLLTLLEQYYLAMTNATAYTVIDQMKYDQGRTAGKLNKIMDKLGIQSEYNGNRGSYNSNSYFNNPNNGMAKSNTESSPLNYSPASMDDIE